MTEADSHHINLHGQDQARQEAIHRNGTEHPSFFKVKHTGQTRNLMRNKVGNIVKKNITTIKLALVTHVRGFSDAIALSI